MRYIPSQKVVHRNLKTVNILIGRDGHRKKFKKKKKNKSKIILSFL